MRYRRTYIWILALLQVGIALSGVFTTADLYDYRWGEFLVASFKRTGWIFFLDAFGVTLLGTLALLHQSRAAHFIFLMTNLWNLSRTTETLMHNLGPTDLRFLLPAWTAIYVLNYALGSALVYTHAKWPVSRWERLLERIPFLIIQKRWNALPLFTAPVTCKLYRQRDLSLCRLEGISELGALIQTAHPLERGERIELKFMLEPQEIVIEGRVQQLKNPGIFEGYGIRWIAFDEATRKKIKYLVQELRSQHSPLASQIETPAKNWKSA